MPTEAELLAAIHADPEDDAPRLVYADWLQEKGDARGELIQVQCRLASLEEAGLEESTERRRIKLREGKLLREHPEWAEPIHRIADFVTPRWRRGFVHGIQIDASRFADDARRLLDVLPFLRELTLMGGMGEYASAMPDLLRDPRLAQLRTLELVWYGMNAADAATLASCELLQNLTRLAMKSAFEASDVYGFSDADRITFGNEGAAILAASPHWKGVRDLQLVSCRIGNAGLRDLLAAPWQLEVLDVGWNETEGLGVLPRTPGARTLHTLGLAACGIDSEGAAILAASPYLKQVETLDLRLNQVDAKGVRALLTAMPALRSLNLDGNPVGTPGAKAIAEIARERGLTALSLNQCAIGPAGISALASSPNLASMETLKVGGSVNDDPAAADALTESAGMPKAKIWLNGVRLAREKRKQEKAKATKQARKKGKRPRSAS